MLTMVSIVVVLWLLIIYVCCASLIYLRTQGTEFHKLEHAVPLTYNLFLSVFINTCSGKQPVNDITELVFGYYAYSYHLASIGSARNKVHTADYDSFLFKHVIIPMTVVTYNRYRKTK